MVEDLLKLIGHLASARIRYCVIGGMAVLLYGGRASTLDFDFYLLADDEEKIKTLFARLGIECRQAGEYQLKARFRGIPVDVLIADKWVGAVALRRAKRRKLLGRPVLVATPEDLIVMKTLADRPIDRRRRGASGDLPGQARPFLRRPEAAGGEEGDWHGLGRCGGKLRESLERCAIRTGEAASEALPFRVSGIRSQDRRSKIEDRRSRGGRSSRRSALQAHVDPTKFEQNRPQLIGEVVQGWIARLLELQNRLAFPE